MTRDYRPTTIESNERPGQDALAVPLIIVSLLLFPITWPLYFIRRFYSLRVQGFFVRRAGRDAIEYQELRDGKVQRLTIGSEMMIGASHLVYVPTEEDWQRTMPDWAQGRREEIVEKVKRKLGTKSYEYDYSESNHEQPASPER